MKTVHLPTHHASLRYLEVPGTDPPLLWLHGWQCTATGELLDAAVQPELSGRRSLLVDFLGHGYSDRPDEFGYTLEDHADTIVTLLESLGLRECGIVGHSMGGTIAIGVAAARPDIVSLLILAEGGPDVGEIDPDDPGYLEGESEADFVASGYADLLDELLAEGAEDPAGVSAVHLGITRVVDPRAIHREATSMDTFDEQALASALKELTMPRTYLHGELSDPDPELERFFADAGVGFRIVPGTGHAMGIQNPSGLAAAVAAVVSDAWPAAS